MFTSRVIKNRLFLPVYILIFSRSKYTVDQLVRGLMYTDLGELILVFDIQCVLSKVQQLFRTLQRVSALSQLVLTERKVENTNTMVKTSPMRLS